MADFDADKHCGAQRANQPPGVLCTRPKGWGTSHSGTGHCKRHGGSTQNQTTSAQKEIARQAVAKFALTAADEVEEIDPRDSLAIELVRAHRAVEFLGRLVNNLGLDVYGRTYHQSGVETGEAKPHVLWVMWMEERKHLRAVASEAARAGVEARRLEIAEQQAATIANLLKAIFGDPELGMNTDAQRSALVVAARHLRALPIGA